MSILATDPIDLIPTEMESAILADDYLANVVVAVAERGNLAAELARKQAVITARNGKRGAAIIILQLEGEDPKKDTHYGPMTYSPAIQIVENVELNNNATTGTGLSARKIARRLRDIFKHLSLVGICTPFTTDDPFLVPVKLDEANLVAYQVNFRTNEADDQNIDKVMQPVITLAGSLPSVTATVTCATAGASIYYTTDGTQPYAGNAGATLYSVPVTVEVASVFRARAFKSGSFPSNVALKNIS